MTASRYSIAGALRQTRGARNATARAAIKHRRDHLTAALFRKALADLNRAEANLLAAWVRARAVAVRRERRAAA